MNVNTNIHKALFKESGRGYMRNLEKTMSSEVHICYRLEQPRSLLGRTFSLQERWSISDRQ